MSELMLKNFSIDRADSGVITVTLDVRGKPLNVLDHDVMRELDLVITELESLIGVRLIVFKSGKESGFLAGADIEAINRIRFSEHAERLVMEGQSLFARIERLPATTLAVIHGPCLGGGLEWALACDYLIARDNSSTKIGLPEIKLGLIPGWGGTQRLPRRVGLRKALSMILTGKHLSAKEAQSIGLVDLAIPPNHWCEATQQVIDGLSAGKAIASPKHWLDDLLRVVDRLPLVRGLILSAARKQVASKAKHYPALEAAIHAIESGLRKNVDGFEVERLEFGRLIMTPTCQQLLRLFRLREQARSLATWSTDAKEAVHQEPIRKLGVIGAGAMGAGITQVAVTRGFAASVKEVDEKSVDDGNARIKRLLSDYASHKGLAPGQERDLVSAFDVRSTYDSFDNADLAVEAVVERMDVKKAVLAETEKAIPASSILATNTSALSVTEMGEALSRPGQFAGLHFFNPVHRMELVEVVRGRETSDATIARLVAFVRALGKTPIVTADSPGFLVNRILFPYLGEAILMAREGIGVREIDREIRRFGMPMGPLELLDRVGLDVALHVAESLSAVLCDVGDVREVLEPMVQRRETGRKSGKGFYDYSGKRKLARDNDSFIDFAAKPPEAVEFVSDGLTDIQRRLIYPMLAEAIRCQEEAVVKDAWAIDLAMVLGTGFAPHRGGPMRVIDQIGADTVVQNLEQLRSQFGRRFTPPQNLYLGAER